MALFMEKVCKENKMDGRIIPLPKEIDAGCGLVWMTNNKDTDMWTLFLKENGVTFSEMVELEL